MVLTVPTNTYNYLQAATRYGLVPRYAVWINAKNRETDEMEHIGIWNDGYAKTLPVKRPDTGDVVERVYQPGAGLMTIPDIPQKMSLEIATLTITFARLTPAIINAVKVYNPRRQSIQIHLALFEPGSGKIIDPAICIWDGIVNRTPVKRDGVGGKGVIELETANHPVNLEQTNATKMSADFFEARGDEAGRHIATLWKIRIPWGQDAIHHGTTGYRKVKFFK
jgi:hypothetical protein